MGSDSPEWTRGKPIWEKVPEDASTGGSDAKTNGTSTPNGQPAAPASKTATAKPAYVDETRYILVSSVIALLPTIEAFLSLTATLPSMTPQISNSLLEILRSFNSRSCQLILGAGATRSAGLKNITTKHLALASQGCGFVVALCPYMRECVRRHLPAGQTAVLAEFDKTKRLFQDHQAAIHDKLVEIMTSRSQAHVKTLLNTTFDSDTMFSADAESDNIDEKPSQYIETLTKETLTLHRVLARHLSEVEVDMIMRRIFAEYKVQWIKGFDEVKVETVDGRKKILRDAEALSNRLEKVEGFGEIGKEIVGVVRKRVEDGDSKDGEGAE